MTGPRVLLSDIIEQAALVFGVTVADIKGQCRKREIVRPRQVVCFLAKRMIADISYPRIGAMIGGKDHSTVINACEKVAILIERDRNFAAYVDAVAIRSRGDGRGARNRRRKAMMRKAEAHQPPPKSRQLPVFTQREGPQWWEMADDDLMSHRIAAYRANGGDFVEVRT